MTDTGMAPVTTAGSVTRRPHAARRGPTSVCHVFESDTVKTATLRETTEWYDTRTGERINCSFLSLPNGYNEKYHKTRKTGVWGWYDHGLVQYHNRPELAKSREDVKALLLRWGYKVEETS